MKTEKHKQLQKTAISWLYGIGCSVFGEEVPFFSGISDALGMRTREGSEAVYSIEAKASRSDLLCFKQKSAYRISTTPESTEIRFGKPVVIKHTGGIDFFYLIVADGITVEPDLYPLWGVIDERGKVIRKAKRMNTESGQNEAIAAIAHVLVYKVFGKMYL